MPVTKGQGNPNWSRDETILALDLYFEVRPNVPSSADPKVIALSSLLKTLPIHPVETRKGSFRNPASVAFKLQNLRSAETGSGLSNKSQMDTSIWNEFGSKANEVKILAESIRKASLTLGSTYETQDPEDSIEFNEGKILFRLHRYRERSENLRKLAFTLARNSKHGLTCAGCSKSANPALDPQIGEAIFEVHHICKLADIGETKTRANDVAVLCANCHRLIHRINQKMNKWHSIAEFKAGLNKGN